MKGQSPGLIGGFLAPFRGLHLILTTPATRRFLLMALVGNLLAVALLIGSGVYAWHHWGIKAMEQLTWGWLADLSWLVAILALGVAIVLLLPILVPIVAAPFMDPLARSVEESLLSRPVPQPPGGFLRVLARDLHTAVKLLLLELLILLISLAATPLGVGFPLALLLGSWLAAMTWLDYPLARRGRTYREKKRWVQEHIMPCTGFGLAVCLSYLVPVYNFLLAGPAAVAGASILFIRLGGARD